ncbi:MAG: HPr family phosphocarrier protein [Anaerolineae bacterium]|nr:HPr family phosphocarrier protein [Anaerolineae bacterium]
MTPPQASPPLNDSLILLDLPAADAGEAIRSLAALLYQEGYVKNSYAEAVLQREAIYPTGLATEIPVALPHTDVQHCLRPALAVARLSAPVAFGMMGDPTQQVHTQLLFMLSITDPKAQVQWLKRLIESFQVPGLLESLLAAKAPGEVVSLLRPHLEADGQQAAGAGGRGALAVTLTVTHPVGLHARPAAKFVQTAARFSCSVRVANLTTGSPAVDAKSILRVLTLGVQQGHRIRVEAEGEGAEEALDALRALVESRFGEEERA